MTLIVGGDRLINLQRCLVLVMELIVLYLCDLTASFGSSERRVRIVRCHVALLAISDDILFLVSMKLHRRCYGELRVVLASIRFGSLH